MQHIHINCMRCPVTFCVCVRQGITLFYQFLRCLHVCAVCVSSVVQVRLAIWMPIWQRFCLVPALATTHCLGATQTLALALALVLTRGMPNANTCGVGQDRQIANASTSNLRGKTNVTCGMSWHVGMGAGHNNT